MKTALTLAAVLCLATVAQAGVISVGTFNVTWNAPTTLTVGSAYGSYQVDVYDVRMVATGALWAGFEGKIVGNLHQAWSDYGETATPLRRTAPSSWVNVHRVFDTYFDVNSNGSEHIQAAPFVEGMPTVWGAGASYGDNSVEYGYTPSGLGELVAGGYAVLDSFRAADKLFAHVVVPKGASFSIQGVLSDANAAATPINVTIPEPASLSLLALGAGAALLRRRRA